MKRLAVGVVLIAAVAAGFVYLRAGEPTWVQRIHYPLRYEQIVRGHARNYRLDPALLAAVIYQESKFKSDAKSELRRDRPHAAPTGHGEGHRDPHGRQPLPDVGPLQPRRSTSATAPGTSATC